MYVGTPDYERQFDDAQNALDDLLNSIGDSNDPEIRERLKQRANQAQDALYLIREKLDAEIESKQEKAKASRIGKAPASTLKLLDWLSDDDSPHQGSFTKRACKPATSMLSDDDFGL
jgi:hypothetical protein